MRIRPAIPCALCWLLAGLVAALLGAARLGAQPSGRQEAPRGEVLRVRLQSLIHPVAAELVRDAVAEAEAARAAALVIELDTPGGLLTSTRDITRALLGSEVPVVVYVAPSGAQAASAGFFILMAADVAAMAPGTNAGAAHPVDGTGEDIGGTLGKKAEEDAAAWIRSLAARNGRDPKLAQAAVVESRSFSADEALQGRLIDLVAPTFPELLRALEGRPVRRGGSQTVLRTASAPVRDLEMSAWRELLGVIAHPNVAYILLTLGGLGLYFELMTPGAVLPGVVGAVCLVLAFFSLSVLPFNYAGLALILLALLFLIAEIKVTSYGLLSVAGVFCLALGGLMLFKTPDPALRVSVQLIVTLAVLSLAVAGFLAALSLRMRRAPVRTGQEGLLHEQGVARSALAPRGKVFVHGELWDAVAGEPVGQGERVEVVGVEGLTLSVRPVRGGGAPAV